MQIQKIPLNQTGLFDKLILDYLNAEESALRFSGSTQSIDSIFWKAEERKFPIANRKVLIRSLLKQYNGLDAELPEVLANINKLSDENVFTITTGHQLNLFTGPLYFIYKIFSTIKLAESLNAKAFSENNPRRFVPVYWMHVEDHDFEEINHFYLYGKKIEWLNPEGEGGMAGDIKTVGNSLNPTFESFKSLIGNTETAKELIEVFQRIYLESPELKTATFRLANELFGKYGLLVFNPNQTELKQLFIPHLERELLEQYNFPILKSSNEKLAKAGYKATVNPREINLFYVGEGFRERIIGKDDGFEVLNRNLAFTKSEIIAELKAHPERFSPNVVLRPLYQETILPNVTYVGGAGELAYWLQYRELFAANEVSFPVLWLRNSVLWIDKGVSARMGRLGLETADLFEDIEVLVNKFVAKNGETVDLKSEKVAMEEILTQIIAAASILDKTLEASAKAETQKINNAIETIEAKMLRAAKAKLETQTNQLRKLKEKLFPNNKLQERSENFSQYYLAYGQRWFDEVYEAINPLEQTLTVIVEEEV